MDPNSLYYTITWLISGSKGADVELYSVSGSGSEVLRSGSSLRTQEPNHTAFMRSYIYIYYTHIITCLYTKNGIYIYIDRERRYIHTYIYIYMYLSGCLKTCQYPLHKVLYTPWHRVKTVLKSSGTMTSGSTGPPPPQIPYPKGPMYRFRRM